MINLIEESFPHQDLLDRLLNLDCPSPNLDVEIYFLTQCRPTPKGYIFLGSEICTKTFPWIHPNGSPTNASMASAPPYTSLVDAALLLKPTGFRLQLAEWDDEDLRKAGPWQAILTKAGAGNGFDDMWLRCDHAANPAIAVTVACLKAHILFRL